VELVEKFAESVAATVSGVKVNTRTRELLEQTQQQAEEMKAQEEEMRQNMEELSATQEELQRQMRESELAKTQLQHRDQAFGLSTILSESDPFGTITFANDKLLQVSKYSREELIGQGHNIFRHPDMPRELFALMWDTIRQGQVFQGIIKNRAKDGTHYWVDATIMPVTNEEGKVVKYIGARYHITSDELAEGLYEKQVRRLGLPAFATAS
jgi:PAS domain S-box-containing protein